MADQEDPRVEAMIRHDTENLLSVTSWTFEEWRDKRPRAYAVRAADAERLLAAADAADPRVAQLAEAQRNTEIALASARAVIAESKTKDIQWTAILSAQNSSGAEIEALRAALEQIRDLIRQPKANYDLGWYLDSTAAVLVGVAALLGSEQQ